MSARVEAILENINALNEKIEEVGGSGGDVTELRKKRDELNAQLESANTDLSEKRVLKG